MAAKAIRTVKAPKKLTKKQQKIIEKERTCERNAMIVARQRIHDASDAITNARSSLNRAIKTLVNPKLRRQKIKRERKLNRDVEYIEAELIGEVVACIDKFFDAREEYKRACKDDGFRAGRTVQFIPDLWAESTRQAIDRSGM